MAIKQDNILHYRGILLIAYTKLGQYAQDEITDEEFLKLMRTFIDRTRGLMGATKLWL